MNTTQHSRETRVNTMKEEMDDRCLLRTTYMLVQNALRQKLRKDQVFPVGENIPETT